MSDENNNSYTFWTEQASGSMPPENTTAATTAEASAASSPQTDNVQETAGQVNFTVSDAGSGEPVPNPVPQRSEIPPQNTNPYNREPQNPYSQPTANTFTSDPYAQNQNTFQQGYSQPYTGYTNGAVPPEPQRKKKKKSAKKILGLIAGAAVFGLVAGGVFIGFNKIYYHFNPDALPSGNQNYIVPGNNSLMIPNQNHTLPNTPVMQKVNLTQTDVSAIVDKTLPASVAITSKFVTNNYFYGQYTTEGGGSGIIIGENDTEYLIATNNHVVENSSKISVSFIDGTSADAYIKGTDPAADLAVIAVKKSSLSDATRDSIIIATLGNSDDVKVGHMVIAIGNALGHGQSTTVGWISAKDREITNSETGTTMTVLQTDAAINPGNSGGALLNMKGEVIGINSAKLADTKVEGIGYAIPISKALPIVSDLMTREVLTDDEKGYLGIALSDVDITAEIASAYNWPMGVYIKDVYKDSAAEKGGLLPGDIITAVNGSAITTRSQLQKTINSYRYGTTVTITYSRFENGSYQEYTTDVVLSPASVLNSSSGAATPENSTDGSRKGGQPNQNSTPEEEPGYEIPQDGNSNPLDDFFEDFFGNPFDF